MEITCKKEKIGKLCYETEFDISSGNVFGIYGKKCGVFIEDIIKKINSKNLNLKRNAKNNIIIIDFMNYYFEKASVKEEIKYYYKKYLRNNKINKIEFNDYIDFFGFDENFVNKKIFQLSQSEKALLYMMVKSMCSSGTLIFYNLFFYFDSKELKKIKNFLEFLKKEDYFVFIVEKDINKIFRFCDYIIYLKDYSVKYITSTKNMHNDLDTLIYNKLDIPDVLKLIFLAKKDKNIKLSYYTDVRDIIKDIYKHV